MNDQTNLIEKDSISTVLNELFLATDLRDWSRLEVCFTAKVKFDMSSVGRQKAEVSPMDISAGWEEGLKPLQAIHHQIGNVRVVVAGNFANASCYGIAFHYLPNATGRNTRVFVGDYDFELQKERDSWKVSAMTFNLKFIDGNKELEKAAQPQK